MFIWRRYIKQTRNLLNSPSGFYTQFHSFSQFWKHFENCSKGILFKTNHNRNKKTELVCILASYWIYFNNKKTSKLNKLISFSICILMNTCFYKKSLNYFLFRFLSVSVNKEKTCFASTVQFIIFDLVSNSYNFYEIYTFIIFV